ncbi:MAG: FAD-dependent oxidoreductase [Thermodesulfobacteriota bacterium]|nr:FAD-dependent oxidoreductase [Thermodesulfobacteriota bacterium]
MRRNYQSLASNMLVSEVAPAVSYELDAKDIHYKQLNEMIREISDSGVNNIVLKNVRGQRYIGDGITNEDLLIEIEGVPGEDLGYGMGGPTIVVHGHAQNAIANTMDSGKIIVHGLGGDALAYGMRGGKLFIRDDVGYRVGIHMKAYKDKSPLVVAGGTAGDFFGEYMAGGTLVLLNRNNRQDLVCGGSDKTLATGIHGGEIFIFGYTVPEYLLGIGGVMDEVREEDRERLYSIVKEFADDFQLDPQPLLNREIVKIQPLGSRPFAKFYYPAYPVSTNRKPEKTELTSPCEAACPAGVPTSRFLRHIRQGEISKAFELLDEVTPFRYSCCGFICPHLCMDACTRGRLDFPVRTAELARRYKIDMPPRKLGDFEGKISIIGAGPAGLTSAYHLARLGYDVSVYDAAERPGGKMYQVISRTRLPLEDLDHDLKRIESLGVRIITDTTVNREMFLAIVNESDYVIVAVGAHRGFIPPIKGKENIRAGIDFLKDFNCGKKMDIGKKLLFIGGGDAAIDGIEAAMNLGVAPEDIVVIDIKIPSGNSEEIRKLMSEGVSFKYPVFLQEVMENAVIIEDGASNRETIHVDTVIAFTNETPVMDFLPDDVKEDLDNRGFFTLAEQNCSFRSTHPKISIVGDAVGLGLVTTNIGRAMECAKEAHASLQGFDYAPPIKTPMRQADLHPERSIPTDLTLPIEEECNRCLHCGVCVQCDECVEACPRGVWKRDGDTFSVDASVCGGCGTCAAACKGGVIKMVQR